MSLIYSNASAFSNMMVIFKIPNDTEFFSFFTKHNVYGIFYSCPNVFKLTRLRAMSCKILRNTKFCRFLNNLVQHNRN